MNINMREENKIEIKIKFQFMEAIEIFGEEVPNVVTSPSAKHLFEINEDAMQMDELKSEVFHAVAEKLIYLTKISQPEIKPTVVIFCTRVSNSNEDDWKKLRRILQFVKGNITDKPIIGVTGMKDLYT